MLVGMCQAFPHFAWRWLELFYRAFIVLRYIHSLSLLGFCHEDILFFLHLLRLLCCLLESIYPINYIYWYTWSWTGPAGTNNLNTLLTLPLLHLVDFVGYIFHFHSILFCFLLYFFSVPFIIASFIIPELICFLYFSSYWFTTLSHCGYLSQFLYLLRLVLCPTYNLF